MNYFDPARPRLANGAPAWLGAQVAIPGIYIRPLELETDTWECALITKLGSKTSWLFATLVTSQVLELLQDWRSGPEEALQKWFHAEVPKAEAPDVSASASTSAEELGL